MVKDWLEPYSTIIAPNGLIEPFSPAVEVIVKVGSVGGVGGAPPPPPPPGLGSGSGSGVSGDRISSTIFSTELFITGSSVTSPFFSKTEAT